MSTYFASVVSKHAKEIPNKIAYEFLDTKVTWNQFHDDISKMTNSFIKLGLKKGDKIATILPQTPAFMNVFMTAANMGLVVVPLDPRLKASEMATICKRTGPKVLVGIANDEALKNTTKALLEEYPIPHVYSYLGEFDIEHGQSYETLFSSSPTLETTITRPSSDDPLIIIFTSGSTGIPKGAMLTHGNTFAMAKATMDVWKFTSDDRILVNLPTSHVGGTHDLLAVQLYAGAAGILMPKFDPHETLEYISKSKITFMGGVPTMFRLIFQNCKVEEYDVSSLRMLFLGGEPSPKEFVEKVKQNFSNATIVKSWGMTETAGFFTYTQLDDGVDVIAGTEGTPGPGLEMRVLKSDGSFASTNEIGELVVKGDSVIKSYLDQEHNQGTFLNGWLKTGDLGFMNDNNYLHYVGRSKEMYISGGYNVYPLEIETYLNAHSSVNASCIIEIPNDIWGEVGVAFVVPEDDAELNVEELREYCKAGLADYKRPKHIIIRNDLPKTPVGKIAKQEIRKNIQRFLPTEVISS